MADFTDLEIAQMHAQAGQRQAALSLAIGSMNDLPNPPGSDAIVDRAAAFYRFLAVTPTTD